MKECFGLNPDYKNRWPEFNVFENWNVRQRNLLISENTNCCHGHCGMTLQLYTLVTKLLVSWVQYHCTWLQLLWYGRWKNVLSAAKRGISSCKINFCDSDKLKKSVNFNVITENNTIDTACSHNFTSFFYNTKPTTTK